MLLFKKLNEIYLGYFDLEKIVKIMIIDIDPTNSIC